MRRCWVLFLDLAFFFSPVLVRVSDSVDYPIKTFLLRLAKSVHRMIISHKIAIQVSMTGIFI